MEHVLLFWIVWDPELPARKGMYILVYLPKLLKMFIRQSEENILNIQGVPNLFLTLLVLYRAPP